MAINFPNNPTTNQIYIYNNQTYVWDDYKWVIQTNFVGPIVSNFIDGGAPDSVYLPQDSLDGGTPDSEYA
jgi:hypothetical protein